ncbi:hypothetical protein [Modestobacter italicus]|uniref:hypothetical protein n=1 Tax=Modestobacter italicus (strain DSM 44449 / CECT 9708 / BC 501) TaxID=2732864 RepID=UPI001C957E39|nr:hypothetical protein [Modestobacter italicus]
MSRTDTPKHQTLKQQGETIVRTGLLAALGAGDAAVDRARSVVGTFRSRAEALPGEAQVQADLAAKDARTRAEQARERAARAAAEARARAGQARSQAEDAATQARAAVTSAASTVRPETVLGTVTGLVDAARTQALSAIEELAGRGEKVVGGLRTQPVFRKVAARTERAVDAVEDGVEDVLAETGETVGKASDQITSVAQKTKARTDKALDEVGQDTEAAAESAKRTVRGAAAKTTEQATSEPATTKPASTKPAKAAKATPAKAAPKRTAKATAPAAETLPDPLAVPAKAPDTAG